MLINRAETVYVAGPMRGYKEFNRAGFTEARQLLRALGYVTICPHEEEEKAGFDFDNKMYEEDGLYSDNVFDTIRRDVDYILKCDSIYMLNGWEDSLGAKAEHAVARWAGLNVYYEASGL